MILIMRETEHRLPSPPHNPGLRVPIEGKRTWDARAGAADKIAGFRGWHERGFLPHRDSPGLTQFITYRLADSFPEELRAEWLALFKIEDERERRKKLEAYLDRCRGECWLRRAEAAQICEQAFLHFHSQRYILKAWCLMPNHVHVLVLVTTTPMSEFVQNWKGYTAYRCNALLKRGEAQFWAPDYWDTYMCGSDQEKRTIQYIENNPVKAGLAKEPKLWPWRSARFRYEYGVLHVPKRKL